MSRLCSHCAGQWNGALQKLHQKRLLFTPGTLLSEQFLFRCKTAPSLKNVNTSSAMKHLFLFMFQSIPSVTIPPQQIFKNCQILSPIKFFGQIPGDWASLGPGLSWNPLILINFTPLPHFQGLNN